MNNGISDIETTNALTPNVNHNYMTARNTITMKNL